MGAGEGEAGGREDKRSFYTFNNWRPHFITFRNHCCTSIFSASSHSLSKGKKHVGIIFWKLQHILHSIQGIENLDVFRSAPCSLTWSWSSRTGVRFCLYSSMPFTFSSVTVNFDVISVHVLIVFNSFHILQSTGIRNTIELKKLFTFPVSLCTFHCYFLPRLFFSCILLNQSLPFGLEKPRESLLLHLYSELDEKFFTFFITFHYIFFTIFLENTFQLLTLFMYICR